MPLHRLCITQVCRVERQIIVVRNARTMEEAIVMQSEGDAPAYDNPNWVEYPDLQSEDVKAASAGDDDLMRHANSVALPWPP